MITRQQQPNPGIRVRYDHPTVVLTLLNEQRERRAREHGHAVVTPSERAWLRAHGSPPPDQTIDGSSAIDEELTPETQEQRDEADAMDEDGDLDGEDFYLW